MGLPDYQAGITKRTIELFTDENIAHFAKMKPAREMTFIINCLLGLVVSVSENPNLSAGKIDVDFLKFIPVDGIGFLSGVEKKIQFDDSSQRDAIVAFVSADFRLEREATDDFGNSFIIHHHDDLLGKDKIWFLKKLRNGIAHQHIHAINTPDNSGWVGIRLWNVAKSFQYPGNYKDFEITLTVKQLVILARYIATLVLPVA